MDDYSPTLLLNYSYHLIRLFLLAILIASLKMDLIRLSLAQESFNNTCSDLEREALLSFKQGLQDPLGRLSSWTGVDCCRWSGIKCDMSGNVMKLDLRNRFPSTTSRRYCFSGEINSSLLQLKSLGYLDLSLNCFEGIRIPEFFGMLKSLRYLNLSFSEFGREIPPQLGNLSSLLYLDLHTYDFVTPVSYSLSSEHLQWLSGLTSIKYLNMGNANLANLGSELLQAVNVLPSLEELHLHGCSLFNLPISLSYVNLTLLSVLDLSDNQIQSSIPNWFHNLTSLTKLDLSNDYYNLNGNIQRECGDKDSKVDPDPQLYYGFEGQVPGFLGSLCGLKVLNLSGNLLTGKLDEFVDSFTTFCPDNSLVSLSLNGNQIAGGLPSSLGKLKYLKQLHISHNCFWGSIPESVGNLSSLRELDVSFNEMNGTIPRTLGQLSEIIDLNLEDNHWQGVLTEDHFMNLTGLQYLYVSTDRAGLLVFNVTPQWDPPFRLLSLEITDCMVGPIFPAWIRVQNELNNVVLHNTGIEDTIPGEWFSNLSSQVTHLELSDNKFKGKLPQRLKFPKLIIMDLRKNQFEGPLPLWSTNALWIFLQQNSFSGPIPDTVGEMRELNILDVSKNHLTGMIPSSICALTSLEVLSLRENHFTGQVPHCWHDLQQLWALDISSNNLSGKIPSSIGLLTSLSILSLSNNRLHGKIPLSLQNCESLQSLNLGDNNLSGNLPLWIGNNSVELRILRLRSNKLRGTIPKQWCIMSNLHILDLAENSLSGVIPDCLGNLSSLTYTNIYWTTGPDSWERYRFEEQMFMVTKGREMKFSSTLGIFNVINLSGNNLTGGIPQGITNLTALGTLNLSRNYLTGGIPMEIGNMRLLETLDLSNNKLSGPIPDSISYLNSLNYFNVSHNNLVGRIPTGNQLQTLTDVSMFDGNPLLCGKPLLSMCPGPEAGYDVPTMQFPDRDFESELENLGFYCGGYVCGICGVWFTLWKKDTWREAYFRIFKLP